MDFKGQGEGDSKNSKISSTHQKNLNNTVKEHVSEPKERTLLKRFIFIENALTYAQLKDKLNEAYPELQTTRQYVYGIVSGRLNPSFSFATKMCAVLGIKNIYTVFDQSDIHLPDFKTALETEGDSNDN